MTALPMRPDPEWLKTLGFESVVVVAQNGKEIYRALVQAVTKTGLLRVGFTGESQRQWETYHRDGWEKGPCRSRYLVKPEENTP